MIVSSAQAADRLYHEKYMYKQKQKRKIEKMKEQHHKPIEAAEKKMQLKCVILWYPYYDTLRYNLKERASRLEKEWSEIPQY